MQNTTIKINFQYFILRNYQKKRLIFIYIAVIVVSTYMKTVNKNEPSMNPKYKQKKSTSYRDCFIVESIILNPKNTQWVHLCIYNGSIVTIHAISFKVDAMWSISPFFNNVRFFFCKKKSISYLHV